jgi:hypothetical protein
VKSVKSVVSKCGFQVEFLSEQQSFGAIFPHAAALLERA